MYDRFRQNASPLRPCKCKLSLFTGWCNGLRIPFAVMEERQANLGNSLDGLKGTKALPTPIDLSTAYRTDDLNVIRLKVLVVKVLDPLTFLWR